MSTRIIFVRHGEADGNIERRFHGHFDSNLTPNGHLQAQRTALRLKDEQIDVIYSSDLKRTQATAGYIAQSKGLKVITNSGLKEIFGGEWEDIPWDELIVKFPQSYENWLKYPHLLQMPGGESMVDFQKRISKSVAEIVNINIGKDICIVTHGTAIKSLVCLWRGMSLENFPELPWYDNTSITIVEYDKGKYRLVLEGDNSHLGELSTLAKQDWWKNIKKSKEDDIMLTNERVLEILREAGVLLEGHFLLTSGRHSNKYLQCAKIFQHAKYSEELCKALAEKYADAKIDLVVGPAVGAVIMAYEVSKHVGVKNIFTERENGAMTLRRGFEIEPGQKVLVVEDVITTGGSVREVIEIVKEAGGVVVGVGAVVDRTGGKIDFGTRFESIISMEVQSFEPENCPICKEGIPLVKPGSRNFKK